MQKTFAEVGDQNAPVLRQHLVSLSLWLISEVRAGAWEADVGECRGGCIYMHVRMDRKEQAVDTEMGWGMGVNRQFEGSPTAAFFW